jgi:primosomal protein N' (replication factor Y)
VQVVPDVPAMNRTLDYAVPARLDAEVTVGSVVRVPLHGRRVRGWVVAEGPAGTVAGGRAGTVAGGGRRPGSRLAEITGWSGLGPDAEVIDLCRWAAWRWAGRLPSLLRVATPDRVVRAPSRRAPSAPRPGAAGVDPDSDAAAVLARLAASCGEGRGDRAGAGCVGALVVSPTADPLEVALAAAGLGQVLFVSPTLRAVDRVVSGLHRSGAPVARWPEGFAGALAGHHVVGGRSAVFAPLADLAAVVVWDEHDEGLQNESSPTWHAREVAIERARRAGVPCLLVSPCPSLEARAVAGTPAEVPAGRRRAGWAPTVVLDRRGDDPRTGLWSERLVAMMRDARAAGERVVCVLNRTGRARLLACRSCGSVADCDACGAAVISPEGPEVVCPRCGATRPTVCRSCGSTAMRVLRQGVTSARDDLAALLREPVVAVSGATGGARVGGGAGARVSAEVLVGTEAVLHRAPPAGLVAMVDVDQELLAPRYRAAEEALALLVAASRLVGGRARGGRVVVQTRMPGHEVLRAATGADPDVVAAAERPRRELLGMPPSGSVAAVGGEAAGEWIERLAPAGAAPSGLRVQGPMDGWWLVMAEDPTALADACAAVERPPGRLRLRVDPVRLPR